jgi:hypothetical protein
LIKLLAAKALLVQSGAIWVIYQLFAIVNVKPTQVYSAPAGRQVISEKLAAPQKGIMTSILL